MVPLSSERSFDVGLRRSSTCTITRVVCELGTRDRSRVASFLGMYAGMCKPWSLISKDAIERETAASPKTTTTERVELASSQMSGSFAEILANEVVQG